MPSIERLEHRRKELESAYDLLSEKIFRLRKEKILETDINVRFKIEKQIEDSEEEREQIEKEIEKTIRIREDIPQESSSTQKRKRPITYTLRPQARHFVNRLKIREQLRTDLMDDQKVLVVIDGLAGIGKTSIAAKVVEEVEDRFTGVYYTKCAKDTDLDQLLAELAYFLGEQDDTTLENVIEYTIPQQNKINFLVESLSKQRYLLIFDDVHEFLDDQQNFKDKYVQMFFDSLLTQAHTSKIMIVSRIRPMFYRAQTIQAKNTVEKMEEQGGRELLQVLGVDEDENLLQRAYQLTAGHPLAMELLSSLTEVMPLEDILDNKDLFYSDVSVAEQLLEKLYDTLSIEEQILILKISIFPRPACREVICKIGDNPDTTHILNTLVRKALVIYDKQMKLYRLHDLVRDFHRTKMSDEEKSEYHLIAAAYYESLGYNKDKPTFEQIQQKLEARYHYFEAGQVEKAASSLVEVSEYLRKWGYFERCRTLLEENLEALEKSNPIRRQQLLMVDFLLELSWIEQSSEGLDKAIERCKEAENILKIVEDRGRLSNLYHAIGKFFYEKASWEEANTYINLSFEIRKQEGDTKGLVEVLCRLRELYWSLGKLNKIEKRCREGVNLCEQHGDIENKLEILVTVFGRILEDQQKLDEALVVYEESLSLRRMNDFAGKALSLRKIGQVLRKQKKFKNALKKYEKSLAFAKKSGDVILQAYALHGIGTTYRDEGRIEEGVEKYEEAVELSSQTKDLSKKASVLLDIGQSYGRMGKFKNALEKFENCLQLRKETNDLIGVTVVLNNIGFLYSTKYSDYDNGLKYYKESLGIKKKLGRTISIDLEKNNIASIYISQGKLDEALSIFEEILGIKGNQQTSSRRLTIGRRIYTLTHIGDIYRIKGEYLKALDFLKESLELWEKGGSIEWKSFTLHILGQVYIALGDYKKALIALEESLHLQTTPFKKASRLTDIANLYYHQGELVKATTKCKESLALSQQYGGRIQTGLTLHLMAKIRLQEKQYAEALEYIQEAVDIFRSSGSRHLSEAEETLQQIQGEEK